jgi:hypothetical protein
MRQHTGSDRRPLAFCQVTGSLPRVMPSTLRAASLAFMGPDAEDFSRSWYNRRGGISCRHESLPQFHCSTHSLGLTHNASEYTHMHCSHNAQCIHVTQSSDLVRYHKGGRSDGLPQYVHECVVTMCDVRRAYTRVDNYACIYAEPYHRRSRQGFNTYPHTVRPTDGRTAAPLR